MALFAVSSLAGMAYGLLYACFCMKKGGIAAALTVLFLVLLNAGLLGLVLFYRTHS